MGASHTHAVTVDSDRKWLLAALATIVLFLIGEVVAGVVAGSVALLADAAHLLTDAGSIAMALWTLRLATRPAAGHMTYGWKRAEILSAQANGLLLVILAGWLAYEAIHRLIDPIGVTGGLVLLTALVGIVVNAAAVWMIGRADRTSLNIHGAFQHIRSDLFAFLATALAGLFVMTMGLTRIDGIAALVVVASMLKAGLGLVRAANRIFLEAAPTHLHPARIATAMTRVEGVVAVHDLHIWEITSGSPALSAHVLVAPGQDCHRAHTAVAALLADEFHIDHITVQLEHDPHHHHCGAHERRTALPTARNPTRTYG